MSPRKRKTDQERLPKVRRSKSPPRFQLTERDIEFIRAILKYRFLYLSQMEWLFPKASRRGMENRLRYLYHNKYLDRIILSDSLHSHKMIYVMTEKGAKLLARTDDVARDEIPWRRHLNKISVTHIQHLLAINNAMISFEIALSKSQEKGKIKLFKVIGTNPENHKIAVILKNKDGARFESAIIPDAIVALKFINGEIGLFFVEVDRATMTTKRWQDKVIVYHEYARSSELIERFKTNWFIVLTITTGSKRVMSLAKSTVSIGGKRGFWYTVSNHINPDEVLDNIWIRASDLYQGCDEGTHQIDKYDLAEKVSILDSIGG